MYYFGSTAWSAQTRATHFFDGETMDALKSFEDWLTKFLEWILVGLFGLFIILVVSIVVLRFGFNYGVVGSDEIVRKSFLFTSAIGGAVGITRQEHIAITFFIDSGPRMLKKALFLVGLFLVGLINVAMIWYAWSWIGTTGSYPWQPFNLPEVIVQSAIPIGCGLAVLACAMKIVLTLGGRVNLDVVWLPED